MSTRAPVQLVAFSNVLTFGHRKVAVVCVAHHQEDVHLVWFEPTSSANHMSMIVYIRIVSLKHKSSWSQPGLPALQLHEPSL